MKSLLAIALLTFSIGAQAGWVEDLECTIKRVSVDSKEIKLQTINTELTLNGPHNGERGSFLFTSKLTPDYTFFFEKLSSGRNDVVKLTSKLGKEVYALSSQDEEQGKTIVNRFLTEGGDYQVTVECTSRF